MAASFLALSTVWATYVVCLRNWVAVNKRQTYFYTLFPSLLLFIVLEFWELPFPRQTEDF